MLAPSSLITCPGCVRHVRRFESNCPFCGRALGEGSSKPRAAGMVLGAVMLAASAVGCGGATPSPAPVYGPPPPEEAAPPAATPTQEPVPEAAPAPASKQDDPAPDDSGVESVGASGAYAPPPGP